MELVERYLHAVSTYLPKEQAGDIVAELKDNLLSRIEEREGELGRALGAGELEALLRQSGHPMLVASRYLPQQQLIGASVYPYWWFSLRLVVTIVALIYVALTAVTAVTGGNPVEAAIRGATSFTGTALFYAAVVTLVFALLERYQVRIGLFDNWQPAQLAPVQDSLKISRGESLFDLTVSMVFIGWWLDLITFPLVVHGDVALPFKLSAAWQPYWWGILLLSAIDVALAVANLLKPYWRWDRLLLRVVLNVVGLVILHALFQQPDLVVLNQAAEVSANVQRLVNVVDQGVHVTLVVIALILLVELVQDGRRLLALR
jgi:hypothetical protein